MERNKKKKREHMDDQWEKSKRLNL